MYSLRETRLTPEIAGNLLKLLPSITTRFETYAMIDKDYQILRQKQRIHRFSFMAKISSFKCTINIPTIRPSRNTIVLDCFSVFLHF